MQHKINPTVHSWANTWGVGGRCYVRLSGSWNPSASWGESQTSSCRHFVTVELPCVIPWPIHQDNFQSKRTMRKFSGESHKDVPRSRQRRVLQETACHHRKTQDGQHRHPLRLGTKNCWWWFVWAGPYTSPSSPQGPKVKIRFWTDRGKKTDLVNEVKILKELLYLIANFTWSIFYIVNPICRKDMSFRDSLDLATDLGRTISNLAKGNINKSII